MAGLTKKQFSLLNNYIDEYLKYYGYTPFSEWAPYKYWIIGYTEALGLKTEFISKTQYTTSHHYVKVYQKNKDGEWTVILSRMQ
jgi:hypothetical protein